MADALIPIERVRAVEGRDDRWCGYVVLPGAPDARHILIVKRDDAMVAVPASCPHEGISLLNSEMDSDGNIVCPAHGQLVSQDDFNMNLRVNEVSGAFFIVPPLDGVSDDTQDNDELLRLRQEVVSLRQANSALQRQVIDVSEQMEQVLDELSAKSRAMQKQSGEQHRLSAFVNRVFDTMESLLVVLDGRGKIMQVNAEGCKVLGYLADELEGRSADDLVNARQLEELSIADNDTCYPQGMVLFRKILVESNLDWEVDLEPKREHLPRPRFLMRGSPIYDKAGKLEGVVIIGSDVTYLREREQALIESEQRFRDYSRVSSDFFWQTDKEHHLLDAVDESRADVTDGPVKPMLPAGQHPSEVAPPEDLDSDLVPWRAHLEDIAARRPFRDFECRLIVDNELVWTSISGTPVYDNQGEFQGYRGTAKDITERRKIAEELRLHRDHLTELVEERTADLVMAKDVAERANRLKSEFIANVSHEFRTPLHAIMSFAEFGRKRLDEAPLEKLGTYFERICESGDRLSRMVNDLLDLAKLEAGHSVPQPEPADVVSLAERLLRQMDGLIVSKQQRVTVEVSTDNRVAEVDAEQMTQVLQNLLSNAIKFAPNDSDIRIDFEDVADASAIRFCVADQGPGIPESELETVFDKFVQSSKTKTGAGGTGLGLAISREIVLHHGGWIHALNNEDGGATFVVQLPRKYDEPRKVQQSSGG